MIENLRRRDVGRLVGAGALVASNMVTTGAIDAAAQERDARGQSTCLGQFGESDGCSDRAQADLWTSYRQIETPLGALTLVSRRGLPVSHP